MVLIPVGKNKNLYIFFLKIIFKLQVTKRGMHSIYIDTSHGLDKINEGKLKIVRFQPAQVSVLSFAKLKGIIGLAI